ncbi:MAG TPA: efflux RND transporter periplasmic adaptor subunit [Candidatus Nanoarchaeia archaeon]|nr:efflux RND transporter periplasmic adaptor subunit [Candidatus Nanoarchaeia archaeon]
METQNNQPTQAKKITPELKKKIIIGAGALVLIFSVVGLIVYLNIQGRVYTDKAEISAPITDLSPAQPGTLAEVFAREGDYVAENQSIARVGDETIKAKSNGIIVMINNNIGKNFNPGEAVASLIDPVDLRVVGHIEENKGLKNIQIGQSAVFTVDAFGGKKYYGVVDEISDTSRQSGIVFNISDKREVREFDVKIRFDVSAYPELKNGMSAKIWIYR